MKRHKIKRERSEPSASYSREQEEHDLAYYIHDRVELMHQVFSALKPKDLRAMTPSCIRHLSVDNIKELCTEELLGISSKRLCAILDGAEPPTDTESSLSASPERLETISLDSISSDEEILTQASKKAKKKHRHRDKSDRSEKSDKSKKKKKSKETTDDSGEQSKASRAGLTVLELLELQARARAIRAQLQQEQAAKQSTEVAESSQDASSSDDEVLVKEEPPEVVEISSDDEKPSGAEPHKEKHNTSTETEKTEDSQNKVTRRINNLVITVPQSKTTRKIKLNRSKSNPAQNAEKATTSATSTETSNTIVSTDIHKDDEKEKSKDKGVERSTSIPTAASKDADGAKIKEKLKKKQKKQKAKKRAVDNVSDHDEIMLQLSDSEKLDLLEDLDRKNFDNVSSQSSEDSESSSSSSDDDDKKGRGSEEIKEESENEDKEICITEKSSEKLNSNESYDKNMKNITDNSETPDISKVNISEDDDVNVEQKEVVSNDNVSKEQIENTTKAVEQISDQSKSDNAKATEEATEKVTEELEIKETVKLSKQSDDTTLEHKSQDVDKSDSVPKITENKSDTAQQSTDCEVVQEVSNVENVENVRKDDVAPKTSQENSQEMNLQNKSDGDKQLSEGEVSDRDSSEVEATELQPEVVCISDDEVKSKKSKKKHKNKEKKNKKEKKSKKNKADFRSGSDQNFYKDDIKNPEGAISVDDESEPIVIDEDDIYEPLELSDDSSCYEVEGTVLSKEPTAEEIEALSAKIDEIERVEVVTEEEIREHERNTPENTAEEVVDNLEQISWKDRYLGSTKVKKVLTTSNILNALRKKNKELKKKLEESKTKEANEEKETENVETPENLVQTNLEEGSIEQYNTLQGSTKYVDPVKVPEPTEDTEKETEGGKEKEGVVTKEMKKDAKQLLKMYKKLLKYNDMNKQTDQNRKKKKKQKKKSKDIDSVASAVSGEGR